MADQEKSELEQAVEETRERRKAVATERTQQQGSGSSEPDASWTDEQGQQARPKSKTAK